MKLLFGGLLLIHGLIHLMGFAKAFAYAELPQLTTPISRALGVGWLAAAGLFLVALAALFAWPQKWWVIGAVAIIVSQLVIIPSWSDARFGTLANGIALAGVLFGFAHYGPGSFRKEFQGHVSENLRRDTPQPDLTEADIRTLPSPVRAYLRHTGAVGNPRVRNFHATFSGRIRGGPDEPWMAFTGEQYNFFNPAARLFIMDASRYGVPFEAFHRFEGGAATMRVKVASLIPVVDAKGPEMTRAETVTLFNDMCVFAPGSLASPTIVWREVSPLKAHAAFTNAGITIEALLTFNEQGELIDFVSDDRLAGSADGKTFTAMRWSTPLSAYKTRGAYTLSTYGAGRWHPAQGEGYDYIQLSLTDIRYNVEVQLP